VHITAADSACRNANQHFIATGPGEGEICEFQMTILRQQQSLHFVDFAGSIIPLLCFTVMV
jgi:hypothetical protein